MKITVFNDTEMDWSIHHGSVTPVGGSSRILRHTDAEFEGPDRSDPFIKVWNGVVMVRFMKQTPMGRPSPMEQPFAAARSALFEAKWKSPLTPD